MKNVLSENKRVLIYQNQTTQACTWITYLIGCFSLSKHSLSEEAVQSASAPVKMVFTDISKYTGASVTSEKN